MTIQKIQDNGKITLTLSGKINTGTSQQFEEALAQAQSEATDVTLNFSEVIYLSSAGLRVLVKGNEAAEKNGGKMRLCGVSQDIMEIFDMTGFSAFLEIES